MNELAWSHHFPIIRLPLSGYDDSIKNERASMETPFSHYKSMGFFLDAQGQLIRSQGSNLAEIQTRPGFYVFLVTCTYKKDRIKNNREKVDTSFSPI